MEKPGPVRFRLDVGGPGDDGEPPIGEPDDDGDDYDDDDDDDEEPLWLGDVNGGVVRCDWRGSPERHVSKVYALPIGRIASQHGGQISGIIKNLRRNLHLI